MKKGINRVSLQTWYKDILLEALKSDELRYMKEYLKKYSEYLPTSRLLTTVEIIRTELQNLDQKVVLRDFAVVAETYEQLRQNGRLTDAPLRGRWTDYLPVGRWTRRW